MTLRERKPVHLRWLAVVVVMSGIFGVIYRAVYFPPHFGKITDQDEHRRYPSPREKFGSGRQTTRQFQPPRGPVQQSNGQLRRLWEEVNQPGHGKSLLVFGLGEDSAYLADQLNAFGFTVFLEDNDAWTTKILSKYPHLNAHVVKYHTKFRHEDDKYVDKATWKQLEMELPSAVRDRKWDVVLVDAPLGHPGEDRVAVPGRYYGPGRFQSIYTARLLTKPGGLIIVDDCERKVEEKYAKLMLGDIAVPEYRVPRLLGEHGSTGSANLQCGFRRLQENGTAPSTPKAPHLSLSIPSESISHTLMPAPKVPWPRPSGGSVVMRETEEDQARVAPPVAAGTYATPSKLALGNGSRPFQPPRGPVQQSDSQLRRLWEEVNQAGPGKSLLVFGLGEDSAYLASELNAKGLTVFLEDNDAWTTKILTQYPHLNAHVVKYHTEFRHEDDKYVDKATWKQLEMELPSAVRDRKWDVVLVDAPLGHPGEDRVAVPGRYYGPGRFQSIYTARLLTKPGGLIIVDDCERKVEEKYAKLMLGDIAVPEYRVPRLLGEHGSTGSANLQCGFRRLSAANATRT